MGVALLPKESMQGFVAVAQWGHLGHMRSPWIEGSTTRVMTLKAYTQHKGSRLVMSLRVS